MENNHFTSQENKIHDFLNEQRAAAYPVKNKLLQVKGGYEKSLYLRVLGMLIQYHTVPDRFQVSFLRRISAGCGCEKTVEDLMRDALQMTPEDIREFLRIYGADVLKYYFCIDGMILAAAGEEVAYELLAELVEALGIKQEELDYLAAAARAVIEQDCGQLEQAVTVQSIPQLEFSFYGEQFAEMNRRRLKESAANAEKTESDGHAGRRADELKYLLNVFSVSVLGMEYRQFRDSDLAAQLDFVFQINVQEYYASLIADKNEIRHYCPIRSVQTISYPAKQTDFSKEKVVIFENLEIDIIENWYFTDCKEVRFVNCTINGNGKGKLIYARGVSTFSLTGCRISGFTSRFLEISRSADRLLVQHNSFSDCGHETDKGAGGIIYINIKQAQYKEIRLDRNRLTDCYIQAKKVKIGNKVSGVFLAGMPEQPAHIEKFIVKDNTFAGCSCKNNGEGNPALIENLTVSEMVKTGNKCNTDLVLLNQ